MAGRLQGLHPGDLGDLGTATLTKRHLNAILDAAMQICTMEEFKDGNKSNKNNKSDFPLTKPVHKLQLQTTVRLLACAQRLFIADVEWNSLAREGDGEKTGQTPIDALLASMPVQRRPEREYLSIETNADAIATVEAGLVSRAPFCQLVLKHLCSATSSFESGDTTFELELPILKTLRTNKFSASQNTVISLLQVVCAAVEVFPAGDCWISSCQESRWHRQSAVPDITIGPLSIIASSPDDLAVIVHIAGCLLEMYGASKGEQCAQEWALLTLIKLTEATSVQLYLYLKKECMFQALQVAWQRIWSILFRADLLYDTATKVTTKDKDGCPSIGGLVLFLLEGMVRRHCTYPAMAWSSVPTDSSFVRRHQEEIWKLPVFANPCIELNSACFELIYATTYTAGLVEGTIDVICRNVTDKDATTLPSPVAVECKRRCKLIYFCLLSFKAGLIDKNSMPALAACLALLTHGNSSVQKVEGRFMASLSSNSAVKYTNSTYFWVTDFGWSRFDWSGDESINTFDSLWKCSPLTRLPTQHAHKFSDDISMDFATVKMLVLQSGMHTFNAADSSSDFVSSQNVLVLMSLVMARLKLSLTFKSVLLGEEEEMLTEEINHGCYDQNMLAAKVLLTIVLSWPHKNSISELKEVGTLLSDLIIHFQTRANSLCGDDTSFLNFSFGLWHLVSGLVDFAAASRSTLPSEIEHFGNAVYRLVSEVVRNQGSCLHLDIQDGRAEASNKASSYGDLLDIDDDDDVVNAQRKRYTEGSNGTGRKRRRKETGDIGTIGDLNGEFQFALPNRDALYIWSSILLTLNPSIESCELVCDTLLGVQDVGSRKLKELDFDGMGGFIACTLLCKDTVLMHRAARTYFKIREDTQKDGSVVALLCNIISGMRVAIPADSSIFPFGYDLCTKLISLVDSPYCCQGMTGTEANLVSQLLTGFEEDERRHFLLRPAMRAFRLRATVDAFSAGGNELHKTLDAIFPKAIVLPSLTDHSGLIRRRVSSAIAAAVAMMDDELRVIESVYKYILPVTSDPQKADEDYLRWYSLRDGSCGSDPSREQFWIDARLGAEWGALSCWSAIASKASNEDEVRKIVFDLIELSAGRPEMELICFQWLEVIAILRGYIGADHMLDIEAEELLKEWVGSREYKLLNIPVILSAPQLMRQCLNFGRLFVSLQTNGSKDATVEHDSRLLDAVEVQEKSVILFVRHWQRAIIPRVMSKSVKSMLRESLTRDGRRQFLEDSHTREFCSVYDRAFNDDLVLSVVKKYLSDIMAFQLTLSCGSVSDKEVAVGLQNLVSGLLAEDIFRCEIQRRAPATLRRFFEIIGSQRRVDRSHSETFTAMFGAMEDFVDAYGDEGDHYLLARVGLGAPELLLFVIYRLARAQSPSHLRRNFDSVEFVCNLISRQLLDRGAVVRLDFVFCVQSLSNLLFDSTMSFLHPRIVSVLQSVVTEAVRISSYSSVVGAAVKQAAKELLGMCMHIHEACQLTVLSQCKDHLARKEQIFRRGLGLSCSKCEVNDTWGWDEAIATASNWASPIDVKSALTDHLHDAAELGVVETLRCTFDIIKVIVESQHDGNQSEYLCLDKRDFIGAVAQGQVSSVDIEALYGINASYAAQVLVQPFNGRNTGTPCFTNDFDEFSDKLGRSDAEQRLSPVGRRLLIAELTEIKEHLKMSRLAEDDQRLSQPHQAALVRRLWSYCSSFYPDDVQLAASMCLGEIPIDYDSASGLDTTMSERVVISGEWTDTLKARCVESLLRALKSPDQKVAMVAVDTLRLLVKDDRDVYERHINANEYQTLLRSFPSRGGHDSRKAFALTKQEQDSLFVNACRLSGSELPRDGEWCWGESLWRCSIFVDYEEWVCCIVSAMICCCYEAHSSQISSSHFFALLIRMTKIDAEVAGLVFFALILELLQRDSIEAPAQEGAVNPVKSDTWIGNSVGHYNEELSKCFTGVFESFEECRVSEDLRVLELVLNTLECLHQQTLRRFMESRSHSRNKTKKARELVQSASPPAPVPWNGVLYGTVLRLDGLVVAAACLRANRHVSAVFYAERYADSRLGGPASALISISPGRDAVFRNHSSTRDISGFGLITGSNVTLNNSKEIPSDEIRSYLTLLKEGLAGLLEIDSSNAICRMQIDYLLKNQNDCPLIDVESDSRATSVARLQQFELSSHHSGGEGSTAFDTAQYLDHLGLARTLQSFIRGVTFTDCSTLEAGKLRDKWFESSLYRMSWDDSIFLNDDSTHEINFRASLPEIGEPAFSEPGFHETVVRVVEAFSVGDYSQSHAILTRGRKILIESLPISNQETQLKNYRWSLDRLASLNLMEDVLSNKGHVERCLPVLQTKRHGHERSDFDITPSRGRFSESSKELLLRSLYLKERRRSDMLRAASVREVLYDHLWDICVVDCSLGHHEAASGALFRLFAVARGNERDDNTLMKLRLQESRILECRGDFSGAIRHVSQVINLLQEKSDPQSALLAEALVVCGHWMAKYKVQPGITVLENYLKPGCNIAKSIFERENTKEASSQFTQSLLALGQLASDLAEAVRSRMSTTEWRDQEVRLRYQENELDSCQSLLKETEARQSKASKREKSQLDNEILDSKRYIANLRKELEKMQSERQSIEDSREQYRSIAFRSVATALQVASTGDPNDLSQYVFMLFSLWFSSMAEAIFFGDEVSESIDDFMDAIPSFRFIPLANQLMSRVGCNDTSATTGSHDRPLKQLILRMCREHPYHCIQHIIYLDHADESGTAKSDAAQYFQEALRCQPDTFRLLCNYKLLVHAYMHLAKTPIDKTKNFRGSSISFSRIGKSADRLDTCMEAVSLEHRPCILTKPPQVRPRANYCDLRDDPTSDAVLGFEREFSVAEGGLNIPKIVKCVGCRQDRYKQLVKDRDEIRQDAVMQQIFGYVNQLMKRNTTETGSKKNNLRVITYNIVPLSPLCGVSERTCCCCCCCCCRRRLY